MIYTAEVTDPVTGDLTVVEADSPLELESKLTALLEGSYPEAAADPPPTPSVEGDS